MKIYTISHTNRRERTREISTCGYVTTGPRYTEGRPAERGGGGGGENGPLHRGATPAPRTRVRHVSIAAPAVLCVRSVGAGITTDGPSAALLFFWKTVVLLVLRGWAVVLAAPVGSLVL
eukprot:COSAG02_NODE_667_length_18713_cov_17.795262_4_plen_119_part_00